MPLRVPTNTGYDTVTQSKNNPPRPNGRLSWHGGSGKLDPINLWVTEVGTGFSMSGSTAQSPTVRDFYARNFVQPTVTITTQFPSQYHMAEAAEFVRKTHLRMESSVTLQIHGAKGQIKGTHSPIHATGYILSFPRDHSQENFAPTVQFSFTVERFISPNRWADSPVTLRRLKSWHDIVEAADKGTPTFVDQNGGPGVPNLEERAPGNQTGSGPVGPGARTR